MVKAFEHQSLLPLLAVGVLLLAAVRPVSAQALPGNHAACPTINVAEKWLITDTDGSGVRQYGNADPATT